MQSMPELAVIFKAEIEAFPQKSKAEQNFGFWFKNLKNDQGIWVRKTNAFEISKTWISSINLLVTKPPAPTRSGDLTFR
jgi:hypothetical protein